MTSANVQSSGVPCVTWITYGDRSAFYDNMGILNGKASEFYVLEHDNSDETDPLFVGYTSRWASVSWKSAMLILLQRGTSPLRYGVARTPLVEAPANKDRRWSFICAPTISSAAQGLS